jgi:hypothetical protein
MVTADYANPEPGGQRVHYRLTSLDPLLLKADHSDTPEVRDQRVQIRLTSLDPVLVAIVLRTDTHGEYSRLRRHHASQSAHLSFSISDVRHVGQFGERRYRMVFLSQATDAIHAAPIMLIVGHGDAAVDEPGEDLIRFNRHSTLPTGCLSTIAQVPELGVTAEVYVTAKQHSTSSHGRWAVRPENAGNLPDAYGFLLTGSEYGRLDDVSSRPRRIPRTR